MAVTIGNSSNSLILAGTEKNIWYRYSGNNYYNFSQYGNYHTHDATKTWTTYSDDRLKISEEKLQDNISDLIMKLKPLKYKKNNYINEQNKGFVDESGNITNYEITHFLDDISKNLTHDEFGMMAQEIYTIPELRHLVHVPYDSDMEKIKDTKIYEGVLNEPKGYYEEQGWGVKEPARLNYIEFIPLLIKGFQEQQTKIEEQQTKIEEQQTKIEKLERENLELKELTNDIKNQNIELNGVNMEVKNRLFTIENMLQKNNIN